MEWDRKLSGAVDGRHLSHRVGLIRQCHPITLFAVYFCIKITYTALGNAVEMINCSVRET